VPVTPGIPGALSSKKMKGALKILS